MIIISFYILYVSIIFHIFPTEKNILDVLRIELKSKEK